MGREHVERGTPTLHVAAWDPTCTGREWTSSILKIDGDSSRIAPSSQRRRDGSLMPDRKEKLLSANPHIAIKDPKIESPRAEVKKNHVLNWDHAADYTSSYNMFYTQHRAAGAPALVRPDRHLGAQHQRVTPNMYLAVFNRDPDEPAHSPRALPPWARVKTRGDAHVPTLGHWADPPSRVARGAPLLASLPSAAAAEEAYRVRILEAQARSEQRMRMAALALVADKMAAPAPPAGSASGALTARF